MLLFRVLYYITPFVLSLLILGVREVVLGGRVAVAARVVAEPSHVPPAASDVIAGSLDEVDETRSVVREERRA